MLVTPTLVKLKKSNHYGSITNKMPWSQNKNEEEAGINPYSFGYKEESKT
jgi:hypothetical protein